MFTKKKNQKITYEKISLYVCEYVRKNIYTHMKRSIGINSFVQELNILQKFTKLDQILLSERIGLYVLLAL